MISVSERRDEEAGHIYLTIRPQHLREGVIKLSTMEVERILDQMGIERGRCLGSQTVCNKPNFPKVYEFVYEIPKPAKKVVKKLDKPAESVTLKKATRRRRTKRIAEE